MDIVTNSEFIQAVNIKDVRAMILEQINSGVALSQFTGILETSLLQCSQLVDTLFASFPSDTGEINEM